MSDQPVNRPNFELVQVGEDEWELLTADGRFGATMTTEQMEQLRAAMANPLPLDPD